MSKRAVSRRTFLTRLSQVALVAGSSGILADALGAQAPAGKKPLNFVLFLIDDLGWTDVGCYGSKYYETPSVDRLAGMGMRFTDGYAACTVCSPTRASMMTGKYPARLHLTDWISGHVRPWAKLKVPDWHMKLDHEEVTLAEALKAKGYTTGFIGKWHLGPEGHWPDSQGFDTNVGGYSRGSPPSYFAPYKIPTMDEGPEGEYLTDRHAADAEGFLDKNRNTPFFLYISMYAVHTPLQAKKELIDHYRAKAEADPDSAQGNPIYGGMVHSMDDCVGRVLTKLEQLGLLKNTAVFFTGDNGGLIGNPKRPITSNKPLRAGKGSSYEGGVREPFIIFWPGVTKPGSTCAVPVISNDFYPTLLEMAGAEGHAEHSKDVDGCSLVPLLKGGNALPRDAIYWHYPHYHPGGATPYGAIRKGDHKLIEFFEDEHVELYNLREDIGETKDLAKTMPELARALRSQLHQWRVFVGAQMPTQNPDYDPTRANQRPGRRVRNRKNGPAQPPFGIVRSCALKPSSFGYDVESKSEGTALRKVPKALTKRATFRVKMQARLKREEGWQNGFLVLSDNAKDADLLVAGLYIGRQSLCVFEGTSSSAGPQAEDRGDYDRDAVHELVVEVDFSTRKLTATCGKLKVVHALPKSLKAVRHVGYHLMQTKTSFSKIQVSGD